MLYTKPVAEAQTKAGPLTDAGAVGRADNVKLRAVPFPQAFCAATEMEVLVKPVVGMLRVIDVPVLVVMTHPEGTFQK